MKIQKFIALIITIFAMAFNASAQWSSDPSKNLALADKGNGNDQVQPKLVPLPNSGWYVSWFDADPSSPPPVGYDVYLQRLSPGGVERGPHNGVLVADLGNSSTEDYGLDADKNNNALVAFLDDREGDNQQVTAAKISPTGAALWGPMGVQLTNDSSFHAAPKIAATGDGGIVVAWTSDSNVVLQKLDAAGNPLWGKGVVLSESGFNYSLSDLHAPTSARSSFPGCATKVSVATVISTPISCRPPASFFGARRTSKCLMAARFSSAIFLISFPIETAERFLPGTAAVRHCSVLPSTFVPTGQRRFLTTVRPSQLMPAT